MTAATILNSLAAHLDPKIRAEGGTFEPSGNVQDTLAKLANAPMRWRCILQWNGEDDLGQAKNVTRMGILVVVQQARGLSADPGKDVSQARAGDPSLLDRVEFVADLVRGAHFVHDQISKRFLGKGRKWLTDPAFPTRQIGLEFTIEFGRGATPIQQVPLLTHEQLGLHDGGLFGLHDGTVLGGHV